MEKRKVIKNTAIIIGVLITVLLLLSLVFSIKDITWEGNTKIEEEQLENYIFPKKWQKNSFIFYLKNQFGEKATIPFVETYDVEYVSLTNVKITVYEKDIVAYIRYMGYNMYFDKDGIVVESSTQNFEGIPEMIGLNFDYISLNSPLPAENEELFDLILDVTQSVKKYEVGVDRIYLSQKEEIYLYIQDVKVEMGDKTNLNEKMADLRDLSPNLEGKAGVLDMKEYNENRSGYTMKTEKKEKKKEN